MYLNTTLTEEFEFTTSDYPRSALKQLQEDNEIEQITSVLETIHLFQH